MVQDAWEGITFNRYYRGQAQWLSVPPIDSHELHRIDLVMAKMNQPETMTPVLRAITNTLASGHDVWVVGSIPIARWKDAPPGPTPLPPLPSEMPTRWWFGSYLYWWNQQVTTLLLDHAQLGKSEAIAAPATGEPFRRRFSLDSPATILVPNGAPTRDESASSEGDRYLHRDNSDRSGTKSNV